jgi:hypothetical protein
MKLCTTPKSCERETGLRSTTAAPGREDLGRLLRRQWVLLRVDAASAIRTLFRPLPAYLDPEESIPVGEEPLRASREPAVRSRPDMIGIPESEELAPKSHANRRHHPRSEQFAYRAVNHSHSYYSVIVVTKRREGLAVSGTMNAENVGELQRRTLHRTARSLVSQRIYASRVQSKRASIGG